jgi:hypothetical protein
LSIGPDNGHEDGQGMTANSTPAKRRRGPGRPWPKGVSGNPSGAPKDISPLVFECRRLALSHAPHAIERLAAMLDSKDERVVVAAAEGILDRAGLKPFALEPERHEVAVATVDVEALRASLAARVAGLAAAHPAEALPPHVPPQRSEAPATTRNHEPDPCPAQAPARKPNP